jgi:hypothetical protein
VRTVFEAPTLGEMAARIETLKRETMQDTEAVADILRLLDGLSDEEAKAILTEKLSSI